MKTCSSKSSLADDHKSATTWTELSQSIFGADLAHLPDKIPKGKKKKKSQKKHDQVKSYKDLKILSPQEVHEIDMYHKGQL